MGVEAKPEEPIRMTRSAKMLGISSRCPNELLGKTNWCLNDFSLVKKLGVGGASAVYQGVVRTNQFSLALKMYFKSKMTPLNIHQVHREIKIHLKLDHPNIIDLWGAFEDEDLIILVIDHASKGDLFDLLRQVAGRMKESDVVLHILHPFMSGLRYLHKHSIIHRDIKLENTLFAADGTLKLADFGLSIDSSEENPVTRLGTLDYMSPEVMLCPDKRTPLENKDNPKLVYNNKVDAWACGVLAYELLVGCPPFGMSTREGSVKAIMTQSPKMPAWLPKGAVDFICWALTKKAADRPSVDQLQQHSWIQQHRLAQLQRSGGAAYRDSCRPLSRQLAPTPHSQSQSHLCRDFRLQPAMPAFPVGVLHVVEGPEHSGCSVRSTVTEHNGHVDLSPRSLATLGGHPVIDSAMQLPMDRPSAQHMYYGARPGRSGDVVMYAPQPGAAGAPAAAHMDPSMLREPVPWRAPDLSRLACGRNESLASCSWQSTGHRQPSVGREGGAAYSRCDVDMDKLQELLLSSSPEQNDVLAPVSCPHHYTAARPLRHPASAASFAELPHPQAQHRLPPRHDAGQNGARAQQPLRVAPGAELAPARAAAQPSHGGVACVNLHALDLGDGDDDMLGFGSMLTDASLTNTFLRNTSTATVAEDISVGSLDARHPARCGSAHLPDQDRSAADELHLRGMLGDGQNAEFTLHGGHWSAPGELLTTQASAPMRSPRMWIDNGFLDELSAPVRSGRVSPNQTFCAGSVPNLLATLESSVPSPATKATLRRANSGIEKKLRASLTRAGAGGRHGKHASKRAGDAPGNGPLYATLQSCLVASDPVSAPTLFGSDALLESLRPPPGRPHVWRRGALPLSRPTSAMQGLCKAPMQFPGSGDSSGADAGDMELDWRVCTSDALVSDRDPWTSGLLT